MRGMGNRSRRLWCLNSLSRHVNWAIAFRVRGDLLSQLQQPPSLNLTYRIHLIPLLKKSTLFCSVRRHGREYARHERAIRTAKYTMGGGAIRASPCSP